MIQLPNLTLLKTAQDKLDSWQNEINSIVDYADRVKQAKTSFARYNKSNNSTFREVRQVLTKMCCGCRRCGYCEDSVADEVEHIKPKDIYPEAVFLWENYLYACGQCNSPKNNKYAVFSYATGQLTEVSRKRSDPVIEPEAGDPVLINPRIEDPLKFLEIDLIDTFYFLPSHSPDSRNYQRAYYTINVLRLNDRDYLVEAREEAFKNYQARLEQYITQKQAGATPDQLNHLISAIQRMQHPTVWKEMQRQQHFIRHLNHLKKLFDLAPEALTW
ncbi:MAG TPA: hypothetical protein DCL61_10315 [Cyanobacteria bacterium UBA12227]|nr:hypothetical protein [Cyanobacteria bacterium UBA12227]HAX86255.1 hypothetical protein [Cyanobacteria bacterium UBA11370]HBY79412.1 hypothetical protein [Cyanobacteria bacterium UBA11148]